MKYALLTLAFLSSAALATGNHNTPDPVTPHNQEQGQNQGQAQLQAQGQGQSQQAISGSISGAKSSSDANSLSASSSKSSVGNVGSDSSAISGDSLSSSGSESSNALTLNQTYRNKYPDIPVNAGLAVADSCQQAGTATGTRVSIGGAVDDPVCTWIKLANTQMMARDNSASRCKADLEQRVAAYRQRSILAASTKGVLPADPVLTDETPSSCLDADKYQTMMNASLDRANDAAERTHTSGVIGKIGGQVLTGLGWIAVFAIAL